MAARMPYEIPEPRPPAWGMRIPQITPPANPAGFKKFDEGKTKFSLLPFDALAKIAEVMAMGAKKYGRDNWRQAGDVSRYEDAMHRHYEKIQTGEKNDPESGLPHIAHLACNALFLVWFECCRKGGG